MAKHSAMIVWSRGDDAFTDEKYSRAHEWRFDGGAVIAASASPHIVPGPYSVAANVDPEEAFVAALSSCHMLFFLSLAAEREIIVDNYCDKAEGSLRKNANGQLAITDVVLRPAGRYKNSPSRAEIEELHAAAHHRCFIANSVTASITVNIVS